MTALKPNGGGGNPLSRRRAFVLLKSGRRLQPLNPDPQAWTDEDPAAGLGLSSNAGRRYRSLRRIRDVELALIGRLAQANVGEGRVNVRRKEVKEKAADLA